EAPPATHRSAAVASACRYAAAAAANERTSGLPIGSAAYVLGDNRHRLDIILGKLDPLLPAEQRQQDQHALVWTLAGVESQMAGERPLQNIHRVARLERRRLGELDQTATLTVPDFMDHGIGHPRRHAPIEHNAEDTR